MTALRLLVLSAVCASLVSCDSTKKAGGSSGDPYASNYGNDGHYNPYPGQSGYASSSAPSTPSYQTPPMPPAEPQPPADPYSFGGSKKPTPASTPTVASSTPKKSTSSSGAAKKKSSSSSTKKKSSSGSRYAVTKGDTLYGIARKKGTTVAKIKAANGISGDIIRPGQSLKIP